MKKRNKNRINYYVAIPLFDYLSSGQKEFCYIALGVGLVAVPILFYLYAEKVFWKIVEFRHLCKVGEICKSGSVNSPSISGVKIDQPQDMEESDGNAFSDTPGNFLFLAYSVDSQLKLIKSEIERGAGGFSKGVGKVDAEKIIRSKVLTKNGRRKIEFISWLRGMIERGGAENLSKKTLRVGVCLAWELHQEFNSYLRQLVA